MADSMDYYLDHFSELYCFFIFSSLYYIFLFLDPAFRCIVTVVCDIISSS